MTNARPQPTPFINRISVVDQATNHLREGIRTGRWRERLPGSARLAAELGVARHTLAAALDRLVQEGMLVHAGERRAYRISGTGSMDGARAVRQLRVAVLLTKPLEDLTPEGQREVLRILALLQKTGHVSDTYTLPIAKSPTRSLAKLVHQAAADGWIVVGGSREVLKWFTTSEVPALASGGFLQGVSIGAVGTSSWTQLIAQATRRLLEHGHRRIVFISENFMRLPDPDKTIVQFRAELRAVGMEPGDYNTPDWDETPQGLARLLGELFRLTPPTALICQTANIAAGVIGFLVKKGLKVPQNVSVVSISPCDPLLRWAFPEIDCVCSEENEKVVLRRIRQWLPKVAKGEQDLRQMLHPGRLTEGNSVGAPKRPKPGGGAS